MDCRECIAGTARGRGAAWYCLTRLAGLFRRRAAAYVVDIAILFTVLAPTGWLVQRAIGSEPATGLQVWVAAQADDEAFTITSLGRW